MMRALVSCEDSQRVVHVRLCDVMFRVVVVMNCCVLMCEVVHCRSLFVLQCSVVTCVYLSLFCDDFMCVVMIMLFYVGADDVDYDDACCAIVDSGAVVVYVCRCMMIM